MGTLDTGSEIVEEYEEYISSEINVMPTLVALPKEMTMSPSPERNLLASLLERAVFDLKSRDVHESNGAYNWLISKDTGFWSCIWILNELEIPAAFPLLVERVKKLKKEVDLRNIDEKSGISRYIPGNTADWFKV